MLHDSSNFKQPLVTLNTTTYDIPYQSCESFGEHGGESGQLILSIGNNKFWGEQEEDEGWDDELPEESIDFSPALQNSKMASASKSNLNLLALVFIPKYSPNDVTKMQNAVATNEGQQQIVKSTTTTNFAGNQKAATPENAGQ